MTTDNESINGAGQVSQWIVPASASANSSALTADSAKAATATKPEDTAANITAGRFIFGNAEARNRVLVDLAFVLTDAANETASAAVWSWEETEGGLWMPRLLCTLNITAGSRTGVSGAGITDSEYFADTIAAVTDNTPRAVNIVAASDGIASAEIDHRGGGLIEVEVSIDSKTATTVKPIIRGL